MTRRRQLIPMAPCTDLDGLLCVLRDNLGKTDAFITTADALIEQCWASAADEGGDDSAVSHRNPVAHLVESAKLAVRAAEYTG